MKRLFTIFLALSFLTTVVPVSFGQTTGGDKNPKKKSKSKQGTSKKQDSGKAKDKAHKGGKKNADSV
jgi:hypothetical protein